MLALILAIVTGHSAVATILLSIGTFSFFLFSVVMFFRNKAKGDSKVAAVRLGKIPFDYLPHESPLSHGWTLAKEDASGPPPTFSSLSTDAPDPVGLSIKPNGWYGMDYAIVEAQKARCNRLIFAANFGMDGKVYIFVRMPSREVGRASEERWIQLGVNVGPSRIEGREGVVEIVGKGLRGGWASFDVSLDDAVERTFGKQGLFYGEYGRLLKIRVRGQLAISELDFYRG